MKHPITGAKERGQETARLPTQKKMGVLIRDPTVCRRLLGRPFMTNLWKIGSRFQPPPECDLFQLVISLTPLPSWYTRPARLVRPHAGSTTTQPATLTSVYWHDSESTLTSSSQLFNANYQGVGGPAGPRKNASIKKNHSWVPQAGDGSNPESLSKKAQGKNRPAWVSHTGNAYPSYPYLTSKQKEPRPPPLPVECSLLKFCREPTPIYAETSHRQAALRKKGNLQAKNGPPPPPQTYSSHV